MLLLPYRRLYKVVIVTSYVPMFAMFCLVVSGEICIPTCNVGTSEVSLVALSLSPDPYALTSAISLTEPAVEYFIQRFHWSRPKAVIVNTSLYFIIGIGAILSYTKAYGTIFSIGGTPLFDALEFSTDSILLPVGGLLIAIFVGYVLPEHTREEMRKHHHVPVALYNVWRFSLRYIAPAAIVFMMLNNFGIIKI